MNGMASRLSSFSMFKTKKSKADTLPLPPPPPPKDPYYSMPNRSMTSLATNSASMPATPLGAPYPYQIPHSQHAARSFIHPSSSSMSLASSSAASAVSYSPDVPQTGLTHKKSGFFGRKKKSARSPSIRSEVDSTGTSTQSSAEPQDDGISLPWNFQHNVHVDDGLAGLPPSWISQLTDAGLSEDEIAAIVQARRNGSRSPYLYNERPQSPAAMSMSSSIVSRPAPRSSSLPRQYSVDSIRSHGTSSVPVVPPIPRLTASPHSAASSISSNHTTPMRPRLRNDSNSSTDSDRRRTAYQLDHFPTNGSVSSRMPATPPRRTYHVANGDSPSFGSPPPSYSHSVENLSSLNGNGYPTDRKERPPSQISTASRSRSSSDASASSSATRNSRRMTAMPPRLSLHAADLSDLASWSEALLSALPGEETSQPGSPQPSSSKHQLSATAPLTYPKRSVVPPVIVNDGQGADISIPHPSRLSDASSTGSQYASFPHQTPLSGKFASPAWSDSLSPTIPTTPGVPIPSDAEDSLLGADDYDPRRDSSRSSTSTISTATVTNVTRHINITGRAPASMVNASPAIPPPSGSDEDGSLLLADFGRPMSALKSPTDSMRYPQSPMSSHFGSEEGSGSTISSMLSQETPVDGDKDNAFLCYRGGRDSYPESGFESKQETVAQVVSDEDDGDRTEDDDSSSEEEDLDEEEGVVSNMESGSRASVAMLSKPMLMVGKPPPSPMQSNAPVLARLAGTPSGPTSSMPVTPPTQRYQKWLADAVKPLAEFIDQAVEPRNYYRDLQEIAEGESGSVYAAELYARPEALVRLKLPLGVKEQDQENAKKGTKSLVAIKCVSIQPGGNEKLNELERELRLLRVLNGGGGGRGGVGGDAHPHILGMEALYVDLQEDSLWIRMELMERSLADVIGLAEHGLMLQERMMARFASDALEAIQFLHAQNIAHRDLRSDNLLINSQGFLKIAEFSNAVRVTPNLPTCIDQAGVLYWQAPEIRLGPYDPLKVDVWSLGATVWEMAETSPPFSNEGREADAREMSVVLDDRWPPLSNPQLYSPAFQDFLMDCSEPAESRPDPEELAKNAFIHNACGRVVIVQVLSQCMAIERRLQESSS